MGRVMKKAGTVVVALTVMSACGGSAALSKADYIKQADALCAAFSRKLTKGTSAATATLAISPDMDALWKGELKQLRALKAPKDDRARVATIWNEAEQAFSKWSAEVKATTAANPLKAYADEPAIFRRESADASAYGLDGCGS